MTDLMNGAVVLVTGGASGIGREISTRFAEHGAAAVVVADQRSDPRDGGPTTVELVTERGAAAEFVSVDVRDPAQLRSAVAAAQRHGPLTTLVAAAGIFRADDVLELDEAGYDLMMDVNAKGVFFSAQAAAKAMVDRDPDSAGPGSSIILLSSVAGLRGSPNSTVYCMSKGAVRLLGYSLAGALAPHGIRVNSIHPGLIATEMTRTDVPIVGTDAETGLAIPMKRPGAPGDIADAALYLASSLSGYVTGSSLVVDGGLMSSG